MNTVGELQSWFRFIENRRFRGLLTLNVEQTSDGIAEFDNIQGTEETEALYELCV